MHCACYTEISSPSFYEIGIPLFAPIPQSFPGEMKE